MSSKAASDDAGSPNGGLKHHGEGNGSGPIRFSPEEENNLLEESAQKKAKANELFNAGNCEEAIIQYEEALDSCPNYEHFQRAVIHSNIAACQIKLEEWKAAIKAASTSLETLVAMEQELGLIPETKKEAAKDKIVEGGGASQIRGQDTKIDSNTITTNDEDGSSDQTAPAFTPADVPDSIKNDIARIRIKALLRRGRARAEAGGWSNLAGAEEDYKALAKVPGLTAADAKTVRMQLVALPPKTKVAQEKEMSEMWGKLRHLGDGILKPFGLSTNNFQMVKDEKTGGYSMNFQGNQGS